MSPGSVGSSVLVSWAILAMIALTLRRGIVNGSAPAVPFAHAAAICAEVSPASCSRQIS
jgi:hypothetical protein